MKKWWEEEYGFFGEFYIKGDNSREGHLSEVPYSLRERTLRETMGIINLLDLVGNERILDVPCGYGRHSIELSKRGFIIVGSDLNSVHLNRAVKEAENQNLQIIFRKENMLELNYKNKFDAVINMFYSFGFFETDEENMLVLKNFYRALKFGGKFLMHTDVNIQRTITGKYKEHELRNLLSGDKLRITDHFNFSTKRIGGKWTITESDKQTVQKNYSVRVYEKDEFVKMCLEVGFRKCEAYSSWKGEPYSEDSEEIMFVAIK